VSATTTVPVRIARPAVAARIAAALEHGAVLLVAGAGAGKTMAVEEAMGAAGVTAAWLPLTERERDPGRLLVAVLEALDAAVPGAAGPLLDQLGERAPLDAVDVERRVVAELDALLVEPVVLVLDDAERLAGATGALALAGALLRARARRLRVVLASRRELGLPIAKARAGGRVLELGEADLLFSADECAELLREGTGREPGEAEVRARMGATLGWPLGLALGVPGGEDPEAALDAFFAEEVLDRLAAPVRTAVVDSAAVDVLTARLLAPLGLDERFLAAAPGLGLPLRPVAGRPGAFAYHPLVREVLRARLAAERPAAERRALLARVAGPLAEEGRTVEAIAAWLDAERWDDALRVIAADAGTLLAAAPTTARGWLERLPPEARTRPLARLLTAQLTLAAGRPADAVEELRPMLPALARLGPQADWPARLVLVEGLYWAGDFAAMAPHAEGFDDPAVLALGGVGPAVAGWAAMGLAAAGRRERSEALAERARRAGAEDRGVLGLWRELYNRGASGDVDEVLARTDGELAASGRDPSLYRPELVLPVAVFLLADQGRLDAALGRADEQLAVSAEVAARPDLHALAHQLRAWVLSVLGRTDEAEAALAAGPPMHRAWSGAWSDATLARIAHRRGRPAEAAEHAGRALAALAPAPVVMTGFALFALLEVVAASAPARARELVDDHLARLDAAHPGPHGRFHRARLLAQRARLRDEAGDRAGAAIDLAAALAQAGEPGSGGDGAALVRTEWDRMAPTAWRALDGALAAGPLLTALEAGRPDALVALAGHPAAAVRRPVAAALARSGHGEAPARLAALARDEDPTVAQAAAAALERTRTEPPPRTFRLLGGFVLERGGWPVDERAWERPMAQRIVRLLLVRRGELVLEDELLEAFWPGRPPRSARPALQVAMSRARAVVDPPGAEESAIRSAGGGYRLVLGPRDAVDVDAFERAADAALAERGPARRARLTAAGAAWTGEPLPEDRYADWAIPWRERLMRRHLAVLAALLEAHLAAGEPVAAIEAGHRALDAEPLDEAIHRGLMTAYARAGRRGRALRQYLECRRALVDELGVEPGEETAALHRRILAGAAV
jgi:ATP/maltotriose-dependent transcriptional regulator MalT/DNA-binding SARP family transcriptional activator